MPVIHTPDHLRDSFVQIRPDHRVAIHTRCLSHILYTSICFNQMSIYVNIYIYDHDLYLVVNVAVPEHIYICIQMHIHVHNSTHVFFIYI
jgi:hypothetical protein